MKILSKYIGMLLFILGIAFSVFGIVIIIIEFPSELILGIAIFLLIGIIPIRISIRLLKLKMEVSNEIKKKYTREDKILTFLTFSILSPFLIIFDFIKIVLSKNNNYFLNQETTNWKFKSLLINPLVLFYASINKIYIPVIEFELDIKEINSNLTKEKSFDNKSKRIDNSQFIQADLSNSQATETIYILLNPAIEKGIYKIGMTKRNAEERAKEISSGTGVPTDYLVAYEQQVINSYLIEQEVHKRLKKFRINSRREFFKIELKEAIKTINEVIDDIEGTLSN